jgi:hypothetical protein
MSKLVPFAIAIFLCLAQTYARCQDLADPGQYMTAVSNAKTEMNQKYMAYMSAAAHKRRAKKVEKMRQETLESIANCRSNTISLPKYKGDNTLRQSSIDYIQFCYRLFNDDYSKIVNMEEIAEQSVDEMEAFVLLQEKTNEKLEEAVGKMNQAEKDFATKYNIHLVETKDPLSEKLDMAGKINRYSDQLYIIFFKCNWEDQEMTKSFNNKKLDVAEQARNSLIAFVQDGINQLSQDSLRTFQGNPSLAVSCRQTLEFYGNLAKVQAPKLTDFYLRQENFDKIKKNLDAKSADQKTKQEIDDFNKSVKDMNSAIVQFNRLNQDINSNRVQVLDSWDKAQSDFQNDMMPRYK